MASRARPTGSKRRLAAGTLLLVITVLLAWSAYAVSTTYRREAELSERLPDLPPVYAATLHREARFPVKLWAHRVNSVRRAVRLAREYRGMEIDVVYDSAGDYFDVGHPPVPSAGIALDEVLAALPDVRRRYFWIDFKNLTPANAQPACARLRAIARAHDIVQNLIVESTDPTALGCFTDSGFYTSYYLFPEAGPRTMSPEQIAGYYREVSTNLAASRVNALSSSYHSLPFMEKYFPDADLLLWYLERDKGVRYHTTLARLKRKERVRVILVREPSAGYR